MFTKAVSESRRLVAQSRKARASVHHLIETSQKIISDSQRLIERSTRTCNDPMANSLNSARVGDEYTMLRGMMTTHKFVVGHEVSFFFARPGSATAIHRRVLQDRSPATRSRRRAPVSRQERDGWARACSSGRPACKWMIMLR